MTGERTTGRVVSNKPPKIQLLPPIALNAAMVISTKDVAVLLAIGEKTALGLMQEGDIEAFQMNGRSWRTTRAKVEDYIRKALDMGRHNVGRIEKLEQEVASLKETVGRLAALEH